MTVQKKNRKLNFKDCKNILDLRLSYLACFSLIPISTASYIADNICLLFHFDLFPFFLNFFATVMPEVDLVSSEFKQKTVETQIKKKKKDKFCLSVVTSLNS